MHGRAATSNDCSSFMANGLQIFRGIDIAAQIAHLAALDLGSVAEQRACSAIAAERRNLLHLRGAEHDRMTRPTVPEGAPPAGWPRIARPPNW
jgi:hypothetical protein